MIYLVELGIFVISNKEELGADKMIKYWKMRRENQVIIYRIKEYLKEVASIDKYDPKVEYEDISV